MTQLPQYFIWTGTDFEETTPVPDTEILVADSWRMHRGEVWGLTNHLDRFATGMQAQTDRIGPVARLAPGHFESALRRRLQHTAAQHPATDLFPRISFEAGADGLRLVLLIRPAPPVRTSTSLWIPHHTDPRTRPTVKGPDIDLMRRLVAEAPTDDVVLHDGTNVIEATTGALLIWQRPDELVLCQAPQQLASISAQRIANFAKSQSLAVTHRPVTIQQIASGEYPVWFANTLHGISPVTTIAGGTGEKLLDAHPDAARWQAAWWARFTDVL